MTGNEFLETGVDNFDGIDVAPRKTIDAMLETIQSPTAWPASKPAPSRLTSHGTFDRR
ncbi:hypothetical protein [Natrinema sp. SYSU A 869]|uniref:hypothetical protein n=1 Tax=Natrinema sp. SYSU A 869 TaxID=2871694 RepID=UPI001CA46330|nr:hypothetical protein [Natrinema sp. SYSU A 869]